MQLNIHILYTQTNYILVVAEKILNHPHSEVLKYKSQMDMGRTAFSQMGHDHNETINYNYHVMRDDVTFIANNQIILLYTNSWIYISDLSHDIATYLPTYLPLSHSPSHVQCMYIAICTCSYFSIQDCCNYVLEVLSIDWVV